MLTGGPDGTIEMSHDFFCHSLDSDFDHRNGLIMTTEIQLPGKARRMWIKTFAAQVALGLRGEVFDDWQESLDESVVPLPLETPLVMVHHVGDSRAESAEDRSHVEDVSGSQLQPLRQKRREYRPVSTECKERELFGAHSNLLQETAQQFDHHFDGLVAHG